MSSELISESYNIDCMKMLKEYPDKHFDLAIADPPYFSGPERRGFYGKEVNKLNIRRKQYRVTKSWRVPTRRYFTELIRVSKNQIVWGSNYFKYQFGPGRIVWDKCNGESSFSDAEIAYCSMHDSVRLFPFMWNGMCQGKSVLEGRIMQGNKSKNEVRIHTTQKPVPLYKWQLDTYGKPGQLVVDTHMGGQSLRIAAHEMGFNFIGMEIDEDIFNDGNKRFDSYRVQQRLF